MLVNSPTVLSMEDLPINNFNGQSYGFTVYRKIVNVQSNSVLKVRNHFRDFAQVLIDGQLQTPPILTMEDLAKNFGSWYPRSVCYRKFLNKISFLLLYCRQGIRRLLLDPGGP